MALARPCHDRAPTIQYWLMAQTYDIAILGGTPAAYAAGTYLAKNRCNVVIIDSPHQGAECPLMDWGPARLFSKTHLPTSLVRACGAIPFKAVRYHNAALDKQVEHRMPGRAGHLVHTAQLVAALVQTAKEAKVTIQKTRKSPAIKLADDHVRILTPRPVRAQLLIIAQGLPSDVFGDLGLPPHVAPKPTMTVAALEVPRGSRTTAGSTDSSLHVVELPERSELGMFYQTDAAIHLRVISYSAASGNRVTELSEMTGKLQGAALLPDSLLLGRARGAVWHPPAGVALDLETHVAKRCLLAGTAGGFADSITGQTLAPSIRSSLLAAEVALGALDSCDPQDALGKYHSSWQRYLADSLRPPSTSLQMLLPLLFVNQRIVGRFSEALLYGEPI